MESINFEQWDKDIDDSNSDKKKLYDQFKKAESKDENNSEILWRLAKVCMYLSKGSEKSQNKKLQKEKTSEALGYAEKACKINANNAECHKWYCASVGSMTTLISNNNQRIKYGHQFKEHADIALKINPNDSFMLFMYGRWCYEVASLGWLEKKLAKTLYGKPPEATYDEALQTFNKALQNRQKWIECHLWIAKTLIAMKKNIEAKKAIEDGLKLTPDNVAEEMALNDLKQLSSKIK